MKTSFLRIRAALLPPLEHSNRFALLLIGKRASYKRTILSAVAASLGLHYDDIISTAQNALTDTAVARIISQRPLLMNFRLKRVAHWTDNEQRNVRRLCDGVMSAADHRHRVLLVFTAESVTDADAVRSLCTHTIHVASADVAKRQEIVQSALGTDASASALIASRTGGFSEGEVVALVSELRHRQAHRALTSTKPSANGDIDADVSAVVRLYASASLSSTSAATSASVGGGTVWSDIGGLSHVKRELADAITLPLKRRALFDDAASRRRGVLLYGPPGSGKTLVAKAVANSSGLTFMSVKGPELLNAFVGESERNVRAVFENARAAAPSVVFFDELDSLAPNRGRGVDGGGVMDRVVAQLLTAIDDLSSAPNNAFVFVIGATNRPDLIDPSLLRPGRLDRLIYLGLPDADQRLDILSALTRKFRLSPDVDMRAVAAESSEGLSGADLYAVAADAQTSAVKRTIRNISAKHKVIENIQREVRHSYVHAADTDGEESADGIDGADWSLRSFVASLSGDELAVTVTQSDLIDAVRRHTPSLSVEQQNEYRSLQRKYAFRAVKQSPS